MALLLAQHAESDAGGGHTPGATVARLNAAALEQLESDPAHALKLAREALALAAEARLPYEQGRAHFTLGQIALKEGAPDAAEADLTAALEHFDRAGSDADKAAVMLALGRLDMDRGQLQRAAQVLEEAYTLAAAARQTTAQATALNLLARVAQAQGEPLQALERLERALGLHRAQGDAKGVANCLTNLGITLTGLGRYPQALAVLLEAYEVVRAQRRQDLPMQAVLLVNIGFLHLEMDDSERARSTLERALGLSRESHDRYAEVAAGVNLGHALLALQLFEEALPVLQAAYTLAQFIRFRRFEALALDGLGQVASHRGNFDAALQQHEQAGSIAREIEDKGVELDALMNLAQLRMRLGQAESARVDLLAARALAVSAGHRKSVAHVEQLLADVHEQLGDWPGALRHHREFHALDKALFNEESDRRVVQLADQIELVRARHEADVYRLRTETAQLARVEAEAQVRARTQELELSQLDAFTRLALATEYRDDVTGKHTWRVGYYAAHIAFALDLSDEDVDLLRVAARLHDVGKIGIPDAVLLKPGKFTPEEYERMKQHAEIGARILSGSRSKLLQMAETIALSHHERWDGRGYPHGLAGDDIPLIGRIVAVADVFDALTHARPYKTAWTYEAALAELRAQRGAQFDPRVVDAALRVFGEADFFEQLERELAAQEFAPDWGRAPNSAE